MAVFRVERTRDYTVMSNYHLKDTGLTLKAKGLLSMMLSLPDEWNYTTRGLASICKESVETNEEDAEKVLGIKAHNSDVTTGVLSREGYQQVAKEIGQRYGCKAVAITLRTSISASDNNWAAMLYKDGNYYFSPSYHIHIWDRVGGGDSFGAGLIYGLYHQMPAQEVVDFATAASCLKHTIQGDFNRVSVEEVMLLMNGDGSGRVQR